MTTPTDLSKTGDDGAPPPDLARTADLIAVLLAEVEKAVVGKRAVLELVLSGFLADGHVLLEDLPGVAKTLIAHTFATASGLSFRRIQFTPDLLPADITGVSILDSQQGGFRFLPGPIFANVVLADEINRAPAKTQSALLEAMQERQVTADGTTRDLPTPFLVIATQNPIEQEGTYPLPEAQLDRFMLKLKVGYPTRDEEVKIIDRMAGSGSEPAATKMMGIDEILGARDVVRQVFVDDKVKRYAVDVVASTRDPKGSGMPQLAALIDNGASVRASISLIKVAKAQAVLSGRTYISPHDVKTIAVDVLRHRVMVSYEAEAQGKTSDHVISQILENVPVP